MFCFISELKDVWGGLSFYNYSAAVHVPALVYLVYSRLFSSSASASPCMSVCVYLRFASSVFVLSYYLYGFNRPGLFLSLFILFSFLLSLSTSASSPCLSVLVFTFASLLLFVFLVSLFFYIALFILFVPSCLLPLRPPFRVGPSLPPLFTSPLSVRECSFIIFLLFVCFHLCHPVYLSCFPFLLNSSTSVCASSSVYLGFLFIHSPSHLSLVFYSAPLFLYLSFPFLPSTSAPSVFLLVGVGVWLPDALPDCFLISPPLR